VGAQKFANNASSMLAASITDIETTIQLDAGYGALFPDPGADEYFVIALENAAGDIEICKVTARTTDLLTVVRGWEDTVAQAWTNGVTRVELRNTAGSMRGLLQKSGDTMEGDIFMGGNSIHDTVLEGDTIIMPGSIIMGPTITNSSGSLGNAITVPEDGTSAPQVGGSPILTVNNFDPNSVFPAGMIVMWWGDVNAIPDGWALCDGNNGRPDLRNRFVVGVGSDYVLGDTGGVDLYSSETVAAGGAHDHGGATSAVALTEEQIPEHTHALYVWNASGSGQADGFGTASNNTSVIGQANGGVNNAYKTTNNAGTSLIEPTGGTGEPSEHDHDISSQPAHDHGLSGVENRPPYVALYYIIKVDPAGDYGGAGAGGGGGGSMYDMYNENGCTTYIGGQATLMDDVALVGGQIQLNCCASNVFRIQLSENAELLAPNNPISGQVINIIIKQAGSFVLTFPSVFKWPGGTPVTVTTGAGAKDVITCQYDSADDEWLVTAVQTFS
jgi:hypothetical protein